LRNKNKRYLLIQIDIFDIRKIFSVFILNSDMVKYIMLKLLSSAEQKKN